MSLSQDEKIKRKNLTADISKLTEDPNNTNKASLLKPYFFISYKSDDWEIALNKIVRRLISQYGLRVYFDSNFDKDNKSWCDNMMAALRCPYCRGMISFVSKEYFSSYACAMELLYANSKDVYMSHSSKMLEIIPIIVDSDKQSIKELKEVQYVTANIQEWKSYTEILNKVKSNDAIDKDFRSQIEYLEEINQNVKLTDLAITMASALKVNKDAAQERFYSSEDKTFFDDITETIKRIASDVFDENLIGKCKEENSDLKIDTNEKISKNSTNKNIEENNKNKTQDSDISQDEKNEKNEKNDNKGTVMKLLSECSFTDDEINMLLDKDYSNKTFGLQYSLLCKDKESTIISGQSRYYTKPVKINGKEYYVTNHWHEEELENFKNWVETIENK